MAKPDVKRERPPRRPYHSPKRAEQARETRRRIRAAAQQLFLTQGYTDTSVNAIAKAAGVALRTVFLAFPSKAAIVSEMIQVAVRGDDEDTLLGGRPQWLEMLQLPPDELLAAFAAGTEAIFNRAAALLELGEIAADHDSELATFRDRGHANMRSDFHGIATALANQNALAEGLSPQLAADIIYAAASHDIYLRLVRGCGWTPAQYTAWLTATLKATLLRAAPPG